MRASICVMAYCCKMGRITLGPPISLTHRSSCIRRQSGLTDEERPVIAEMIVKGTHGMIVAATNDLDGTFARLHGWPCKTGERRSSGSQPSGRTGFVTVRCGIPPTAHGSHPRAALTDKRHRLRRCDGLSSEERKLVSLAVLRP